MMSCIILLSNSNQYSTFQDFLEADLTNIELESLFSAVILVEKNWYSCLVVNSTIYNTEYRNYLMVIKFALEMKQFLDN